MSQNYTFIRDKTDSFRGSDILIDVWSKHKIGDMITSHLGVRSPRAEYSYAEGLLSLFISQYNWSDRIEHFKDVSDSLIALTSKKKAMSPDSFLFMSKELAIPKRLIKINTEIDTNKRRSRKKRYVNHEVIVIDRFNKLLVETAVKLNLLNCHTEYILDFDTTDIETKIKDARRYYKGNGTRAYCPAVAFINNIPIYIENRNGNTNASFNLINSVTSALELLSKNGIKIRLIRSDAAAFSKKFVAFANANGLKFITRAKNNTVQNQIENIKNWKHENFKGDIDKVGDCTFFFGDEETRLIIKSKSQPIIDDDGKETKDLGFATNDFETAMEDIINTYEIRGKSEHLFRELKEFGWKLLPMRKIEFNTVYLYFTAFNYIVCRFMKKLLGTIFKEVKETMKFKTFIRKFKKITRNWIGEKLVFPISATEHLNL